MSNKQLILRLFIAVIMVVGPQTLTLPLADPPAQSIQPPLDGSIVSLMSHLAVGDSFSLFMEDMDLGLDIERVQAGLAYRMTRGITETSVLDMSELAEASYEVLAVSPDSFSALLHVPVAGTGVSTMVLSGIVDTSTSEFRGVLTSTNGTFRTSLNIELPSGSLTPQMIIIISAAVIGVLACAIVALATNCAEDCGEACAKNGGRMKNSTEGPCGSCRCECY